MALENIKLFYYLQNIFRSVVPVGCYRRTLAGRLKRIDDYDQEAIRERVDYYCKRGTAFDLPDDAGTYAGLSSKGKSAYRYDLKEVLRYFPPCMRLAWVFGDVITVPEIPTIQKARPIAGDNENAVLMKLNKVRHFRFVHDRKPFEAKKNQLVWRGAAYLEPRRSFVPQHYQLPRTDIGQTNRPREGVPWQKPELSIKAQLDYKFILSIEGNDVATSLKWIMSSNSLCFMRRPRYETWFMEGRLRAGYHYVQLKDDFSDITEKMDYYTRNTAEAQAIIENAQRHVEQFRDKRRETLIALLVLKKYFALCGQPLAL